MTIVIVGEVSICPKSTTLTGTPLSKFNLYQVLAFKNNGVQQPSIMVSNSYIVSYLQRQIPSRPGLFQVLGKTFEEIDQKETKTGPNKLQDTWPHSAVRGSYGNFPLLKKAQREHLRWSGQGYNRVGMATHQRRRSAPVPKTQSSRTKFLCSEDSKVAE